MKKNIKVTLCCLPILATIFCYGKMLSMADTNMEKYSEEYTPLSTETHYSPWQDDEYIICEVDHWQDDCTIGSDGTILHVIMPDGSIQMYAIEDKVEPTEVLFLPNDSYADYEIVDVR